MTPSPGLWYAGIDEAGYGPMLGPLCVGASAFVVPDGDREGRPPGLWDMLAAAIVRSPREDPSRVAVNDSKRLKLPNSSRSRHPLTHIERGVLAFLPSMPENEAHAFAQLGVRLDASPWYRGDPYAVRFPVSATPAMLLVDRNVVAAAMADASVEPAGLSCRACCEREFNERCQGLGSKAEVNAALIAGLISDQIQAAACERVRVVCDRQSGRQDYTRLVEQAAPGRGVREIARTPRVSAYRVEDPDRDIVVRFEVEADGAHLPVALASMTAKYVRELSMARFNRFWCARVPELRPTAGYTTDARRWLAEVEGHADPADLRRLVRRS